MKKYDSIQITRRSFMRRMSALAAITGLPLWYLERQVAAAQDVKTVKSPNQRLRMALIGAGNMGTGDAFNALRFADLVAVCDVDDRRAQRCVAQATEKNKGIKPKTYSDFRKMIDQEKIDVIINGTPDHWHTLINMYAAKSGLDIYSEKPLTLTIDEGKRLTQVVRDHKRILQTGTQQRSSGRFRLACELVRNGRIGKLKEVTVWLPAGLNGGPFKSRPVPEGLNWDFWQGQAKAYDYLPERCHVNFRNWWDYSGGTMTDWGAHHMDIGYWAIGLKAPSKVEGTPTVQPIPGGYTTFSEYQCHYEFANGVSYHVKTTTDESPYGQILKEDGQRNGIKFIGEDGWIWVNRGEIRASDRNLLRAELPDDAERLYVSNDHVGNFFDCVDSRKDPICPVEVGHRSATVCHLGTIALRTGKQLTWDGDQECFTGDHAEEANTYVARAMRAPYDYSFVS
jgi:predicted dehydrogenase